IDPGVVRVPLRLRSESARVAFAWAVSLLPGTVAAVLGDDELTIHALDTSLPLRERLLELANADLGAPVERLREPIERYDELIREAFREYRLEASAREVFALLERSRWYPFIAFELPPDDLERFVLERPAGEYTIPELLEYADYSRSKLSHYVEDADELKRTVATQRTYLEGIDGEPLTVGWPPGPAGLLERRTREFRPFVDRVADEETVVALREVRALARDDEYDRLQTAAQAVEQLTADERERLREGRVEAELESLRTERERLEAALDVDDPV
ncbi:Na+/H+ antiporter subunit E, partial [Natronococcus sp.]|uniref:Na+/H+ antiporter subunit E n=1 Tax=Natronococcus sp. TaxID=35747 RepID=UPI003A4DEE8C